MNYAVIDTSTNKVVNVVSLVNDTQWSPPEGTFITPVGDSPTDVDDYWDGTQVVRLERIPMIFDPVTGQMIPIPNNPGPDTSGSGSTPNVIG